MKYVSIIHLKFWVIFIVTQNNFSFGMENSLQEQLQKFNDHHKLCKQLDADFTVDQIVWVAENLSYKDFLKYLKNIGYLVNFNKKIIDLQNSRKAQTPLICAISLRREEACSVLLKAGADVNILDFLGNTALHYAYHNVNYLHNGNYKLISDLKNLHAKSIKNRDNYLPEQLPLN